MLKRVPLQTISELHRRIEIKQTEPAIFTRFPYFEYFEKHNPRDIILMIMYCYKSLQFDAVRSSQYQCWTDFCRKKRSCYSLIPIS
jgi:hypothetical protein